MHLMGRVLTTLLFVGGSIFLVGCAAQGEAPPEVIDDEPEGRDEDSGGGGGGYSR